MQTSGLIMWMSGIGSLNKMSVPVLCSIICVIINLCSCYNVLLTLLFFCKNVIVIQELRFLAYEFILTPKVKFMQFNVSIHCSYFVYKVNVIVYRYVLKINFTCCQIMNILLITVLLVLSNSDMIRYTCSFNSAFVYIRYLLFNDTASKFNSVYYYTLNGSWIIPIYCFNFLNHYSCVYNCFISLPFIFNRIYKTFAVIRCMLYHILIMRFVSYFELVWRLVIAWCIQCILT